MKINFSRKGFDATYGGCRRGIIRRAVVQSSATTTIGNFGAAANRGYTSTRSAAGRSSCSTPAGSRKPMTGCSSRLYDGLCRESAHRTKEHRREYLRDNIHAGANGRSPLPLCQWLDG